MTDNNATNARANKDINHHDGGATKRWWERTDPNLVKDDNAQEAGTTQLRRPNAPAARRPAAEPDGDDGAAYAAPAQPVMSGARTPASTVPSGAAGSASKKRWWESKDPDEGVLAVPDMDEAPVETPPARTNAFNRPTADPARIPPKQSAPIPQERPARETSFEDLAPPPQEAAPRPSGAFARPAAARPAHAVPVEEAAPPAAPKVARGFGRPAPAPAPAIDDDEDDFEPVIKKQPAPMRAKATFSKPRAEPVFEDDDDDDDEDEVAIVAPKPGKRPGLFGRMTQKSAPAAAPVDDEEDEVAPAPVAGGIPAPRRGSVESKKGPKSSMPNNVFARSNTNMFEKTQKPKEFKAPVIPKRPEQLPFDTEDASKQQQKTVAARKRRAGMRTFKSFLGRFAGPIVVLGACAGLVASGIVNVSLDNGFDVKVNWPDQVKPAVTKVESVVTEKAVPVLGKIKDSVGEKAKPYFEQVTGMLTVPTATPSAGGKIEFSKEKIQP